MERRGDAPNRERAGEQANAQAGEQANAQVGERTSGERTSERAGERAGEHSSSQRFRALFHEGFPYVLSVLRRFGVVERDLDDAAQEVFVTVHRHFAAYDATRPLRPWLLTFAFHVASNYRRLARHRHEPVSAESSGRFEAVAEQRSDDSTRHEARDLLMRALDALPFIKRDVFVMHDIEGLEAREIAPLLGIPVNTVYSRLRLAREELELLTRSLAEEAS